MALPRVGDVDDPSTPGDERIRVTGQVNTLNHPFSPVPFGADLFAEFGDEMAMPIVGNFDPPVSPAATQFVVQDGDYNADGRVDNADYDVWKSSFNSRSNLAADGNGNGVVDLADYTVWQNHKSAPAAAGLAASMAGDYDGSGQVAAADYGTWTSSFGSTSNLVADGNGDGFVNAADYTVWRNNLVRGRALVRRRLWRQPKRMRSSFRNFQWHSLQSCGLFSVAAPAQADDLSLLLAVSRAPSTSVSSALEEFGVVSTAEVESDAPTSLDELALAAAWQSWDEL